jgi:hypothetical protein
MKKSVLSLLIIVLITVSCKKSYNCECIITYNVAGNPKVAATTILNDTKIRATKDCNNLSTVVAGVSTTTCSIQ